MALLFLRLNPSSFNFMSPAFADCKMREKMSKNVNKLDWAGIVETYRNHLIYSNLEGREKNLLVTEKDWVTSEEQHQW